VHVGRLDGRAFSLPTLKRLATMLWMAEPTLRSTRDPRSPNYHNRYTWGAETRRYSRLAGEIVNNNNKRFVEFGNNDDDDDNDDDDEEREQVARVLRDSSNGDNTKPREMMSPDDLKAIHLIWQQKSHQDLGLLLSGSERQYRRLGFNFSAFGLEDDRAARSPRTVEFRVMEGTLRGDLVSGWLAICCTLAEVAAAIPSAAAVGVLRSDDHDHDHEEEEEGDGRFVRMLSHMVRQSGHHSHSHYSCHHHPTTTRGANNSCCGGPPEETPGGGGGGGGGAGGQRLAREFRELMQVLGVPEVRYRGFEEKIARENY
jgi:hypothetical protein